jgi:spoIIIJ-associated protein
MNEVTSVGDDGRRVLEVRARTVDEAVARGLVRLGGLSRNEVDIDVLSEGRPGLLGFGAEEALVRLTVLRPGERPADRPSPAPAEPAAPAERPAEPPAEAPAAPPVRAREEAVPEAPAEPRAESTAPAATMPAARAAAAGPADLDAALTVAAEVTLAMLGLLGLEQATVERSDALLPSDVEDAQSLVLGIHGPGTDRLLANDSEGLNALQFLVRLVVSRRLEGWVSVLLDVEGDRARRVQELLALADQSATLVAREGRPVALPPMSAYERRVVHLALRDHPEVATQSIGSGDYRKVTVRRRDQLLPEP